MGVSNRTDTRHDGDQPIPHLAFDSDDYPPTDRLPVWQALTPSYRVTPAVGEAADFCMKSEAWLLGDLIVTRGSGGPVRLERSLRHVEADGREAYSLVLLTRGGWSVSAASRRFEVAAGTLCLLDFAQPWSSEGSANDHIIVVIPRARLDVAEADAASLHGRVIKGVAGELLAGHLVALADRLSRLVRSETPGIERTMLAMLASCLASAPGAPAGRQNGEALAGRVRRFIDKHLEARQLGPALICRELAITRPTLYRAFAPAGGIVAYIQQRRLEAAHALLAAAKDKRNLADIAKHFGFKTHAHFSTAFRRRYGCSPRDVRDRGAAGGQGGFQRWRERLEDEKSGKAAGSGLQKS